MGPICAVLIEDNVSQSLTKALDEIIDSISARRDGHDFTVCDTRPLSGKYLTYYGGRSFGFRAEPWDWVSAMSHPQQRELFSREFGFLPQTQLAIWSYPNSQIDHIVLGEVAAGLAEIFRGVIDYAGTINMELPHQLRRKVSIGKALWCDVEPYFLQMVSSMAGKIVAVPHYSDYWEATWVSHYSDAAFLRAWLNHPRFAMTK